MSNTQNSIKPTSNVPLTFDELQAIWDDHTRRIDRIDETHPTLVLNYRRSTPFRIQMLVRMAILTILTTACATYWTILIPTLAYSTAALVTCLVIESIYLLIFAESLYWTVFFIVSDPARIGILRMSRILRHAHLRPHYVPRPSVNTPTSHQLVNYVKFCTRRISAISIAAMFALIVVSCTSTGIDGHTITQDHPDRAATIENVSNLINSI